MISMQMHDSWHKRSYPMLIRNFKILGAAVFFFFRNPWRNILLEKKKNGQIKRMGSIRMLVLWFYPTQINKFYPMFVPYFKIPGAVVSKNSLNKTNWQQTDTHTDTYTKIVTEDENCIPCTYAGVLSQPAFCLNLYRAIIGPTGFLSGR